VKRSLATVLLLILVVAALPGCGSMATMATTGAAKVSATTTLGSQGALEKYRADMKAWYDKYTPRLNAALGHLSVSDPSNASAQQIANAANFKKIMDNLSDAIMSIEAPDNLEIAQCAYRASLIRVDLAAKQYVDDLTKKYASGALEAYATITGTHNIAKTTADTVLETSLGYKPPFY